MSTLTKPIPCRLHPDTRARLESVAKKFGMKPAALIRYALDNQLPEYERSGKIVIERKAKQNA